MKRNCLTTNFQRSFSPGRSHGRFPLVIFLLSLLIAEPSSSQGFLTVSGATIVNGNGQNVLLRGIGLGGWLVPEGYMLHTDGFANSPTEIRNKISSLIGPANTDSFFTLYRANYVTRKDVDQIAQWGFNSIRLPMHYALLTPKDQPGVYSEAGFALIDSLLSWCEVNHLYLILDLHCAPGGQNSANISDYIPTEPSLWQSIDNQNRTIALWKKIAERYATKEWIGGYDLLNETVWTFGTPNPPLMNLRELSIAITNAIRQVDTTHIIFIEGNNWATDFTGLTPPWDAKMAYSFHKYWNVNSLSAISGYIALRNSSNRPLWLGESGENSNQWFADCIALMESYNIGWSWWPHKKIASIAGPLSATQTPEYSYLLSYWKGQAAMPSVDYATSALFRQAEMLAIDRCRFQPDVIDALFRQPFTNDTKPFAENRIPGIIYGTDYDMGKVPYAYKDNDYQNTGGGAYNSGYQYRNDGVDIEKCNDLPTNGYDVGWIGDGEFLRFTITVQQTANYSVNLRVAAQSSGAQIFVQVDDSITIGGLISIASTGGWQNWKTIPIGTQQLNAGIHKLRIVFLKSGCNFSFIRFAQSDGVGPEAGLKQLSFRLDQNFPNPFNPSTVIAFTIPRTGFVQLDIFDVLGRMVDRRTLGPLTAGEHQLGYDARGKSLSSGIYYFRLNFDGMHSALRKAILLQ